LAQEERTQSEIDRCQEIEGDNSCFMEICLKKVLFIKLDKIGHIGLGRIFFAFRDSVGIDIHSNAAGSEIDGTLSVASTREQYNMDVKARATNQTLFRAEGQLAPYDDAVALPVLFGWIPNGGDDPQGQPQDQGKKQ